MAKNTIINDKIDYNEILCEAVDTIVKKRLENVSYDNTVIAEIIDASNAEFGHYIVREGQITYDVLSDNTNYKVGEQVYVTVPGNNYDNTKIIVSAYKDEETLKALSLTQPQDILISQEIEIDNQKPLMCEATSNHSTTYSLNCMTASVQGSDLAIYDSLIVTADFQCNISSYDRYVYEGNYGLAIYGLPEENWMPDTSDDNSWVKQLKDINLLGILSSKNFMGNPYNLPTPVTQSIVLDITKSQIDINTIKTLVAVLFADGNFLAYNLETGQSFDFNYDITELSELNLPSDVLNALIPPNGYNYIYATNLKLQWGFNRKAKNHTFELYELLHENSNERCLIPIWYNINTETKENLGYADDETTCINAKLADLIRPIPSISDENGNCHNEIEYTKYKEFFNTCLKKRALAKQDFLYSATDESNLRVGVETKESLYVYSLQDKLGATFKELANAIKTTYQDIISFDPINLLENIAPPTSTSNSNSIVGSQCSLRLVVTEDVSNTDANHQVQLYIVPNQNILNQFKCNEFYLTIRYLDLNNLEYKGATSEQENISILTDERKETDSTNSQHYQYRYFCFYTNNNESIFSQTNNEIFIGTLAFHLTDSNISNGVNLLQTISFEVQDVDLNAQTISVIPNLMLNGSTPTWPKDNNNQQISITRAVWKPNACDPITSNLSLVTFNENLLTSNMPAENNTFQIYSRKGNSEILKTISKNNVQFLGQTVSTSKGLRELLILFKCYLTSNISFQWISENLTQSDNLYVQWCQVKTENGNQELKLLESFQCNVANNMGRLQMPLVKNAGIYAIRLICERRSELSSDPESIFGIGQIENQLNLHAVIENSNLQLPINTTLSSIIEKYSNNLTLVVDDNAADKVRVTFSTIEPDIYAIQLPTFTIEHGTHLIIPPPTFDPDTETHINCGVIIDNTFLTWPIIIDGTLNMIDYVNASIYNKQIQPIFIIWTKGLTNLSAGVTFTIPNYDEDIEGNNATTNNVNNVSTRSGSNLPSVYDFIKWAVSCARNKVTEGEKFKNLSNVTESNYEVHYGLLNNSNVHDDIPTPSGSSTIKAGGYVFGTTGNYCNTDLQNSRWDSWYHNSSTYGNKRSLYNQHIKQWEGKYVVDCQGLCDWWYTQATGVATDISAAMNFQYWCNHTTVSGPYQIGDVVFKEKNGAINHVGWICGWLKQVNSDITIPLVVEAKNLKYGIVLTKLDNGWAKRGRMINKFDYSYSAPEDASDPSTEIGDNGDILSGGNNAGSSWSAIPVPFIDTAVYTLLPIDNTFELTTPTMPQTGAAINWLTAISNSTIQLQIFQDNTTIFNPNNFPAANDMMFSTINAILTYLNAIKNYLRSEYELLNLTELTDNSPMTIWRQQYLLNWLNALQGQLEDESLVKVDSDFSFDDINDFIVHKLNNVIIWLDTLLTFCSAYSQAGTLVAPTTVQTLPFYFTRTSMELAIEKFNILKRKIQDLIIDMNKVCELLPIYLPYYLNETDLSSLNNIMQTDNVFYTLAHLNKLARDNTMIASDLDYELYQFEKFYRNHYSFYLYAYQLLINSKNSETFMLPEEWQLLTNINSNIINLELPLHLTGIDKSIDLRAILFYNHEPYYSNIVHGVANTTLI